MSRAKMNCISEPALFLWRCYYISSACQESNPNWERERCSMLSFRWLTQQAFMCENSAAFNSGRRESGARAKILTKLPQTIRRSCCFRREQPSYSLTERLPCEVIVWLRADFRVDHRYIDTKVFTLTGTSLKEGTWILLYHSLLTIWIL